MLMKKGILMGFPVDPEVMQKQFFAMLLEHSLGKRLKGHLTLELSVILIFGK